MLATAVFSRIVPQNNSFCGRRERKSVPCINFWQLSPGGEPNVCMCLLFSPASSWAVMDRLHPVAASAALIAAKNGLVAPVGLSVRDWEAGEPRKKRIRRPMTTVHRPVPGGQVVDVLIIVGGRGEQENAHSEGMTLSRLNERSIPRSTH